MGREPREYVLFGRILRVGPQAFTVVVRATALDLPAAAGAAFAESRTAHSLGEARALQWDMLRELSARLRAQGHQVVDVEGDL
jgi:hypothetical protein